MKETIVHSAHEQANSWIVRQRDQFEQDWQAGREPRIENILAGLPPEHHEPVLRELLTVELTLRQQRGDKIKRAEYESRLPSENTAVLDEFQATFAIDPNATLTNCNTDTAARLDDDCNSATTATRYRNLRLFRRGGLGALYKAYDESLHRETVVKFMNEKCEHDPALQTQFRVEAEITSRLDHPGIVPVYGIGEDWNGRLFYVMRLINGRELKEAIQEYHQAGGPTKRGSKNRQLLFGLLEHLASACNTIAYAHHVGIVHCDIKPANIMIGKYGETFVLDWGLATPFERTATFVASGEATMRPSSLNSGSTSGQRGGTYGYISPEQLCTDAPLAPTSDVYSLGATLYEILTGQAPFSGHDRDVVEQIRFGRFRAPRSLQQKVPRALELICLKAMRLSPLERYPSASHLAADLTNWMRDEEISAVPDRWYDRLARFTRRHWGMTGAAILIGLAVLLAAGAIDRNLKLAQHERELQSTREIEKQGFTTALNTFEDLCRPLANGQVNNLGAFQPFFGKIKNFANEYLDHFEKAESMRLHTARVFELRATVSQVNSQNLDQATSDYARAAELYEGLTSDDGDAFDNRMRLAHARLGQGRLFIQRREQDKSNNDRAIDSLNGAVSLYESLRLEQPTSTLLLRDLVETYHCLGEAYLNRENDGSGRQQALRDSEGKFEKSKAIREQLVKSTTGVEQLDHVRDLARSLGYLGDLYLAQGEVGKAIDAYEGSKDQRHALHRQNPLDPEHRFQYSRGLANFAGLDIGYRGNFTEALQRLTEAEKLQRDLTTEFSEVSKFSRDLASTQNSLAELHLLAASVETDPQQAAEHRRSAKQAAKEAVEILERIYPARNGQSDPDAIPGRALALVLSAASEPENETRSQGLAKQAEELLQQLGPDLAIPRAELVTLALARSLQGAGRADSAFRALKEAVDRGENTAERFARHRSIGFKGISDDNRLGPQFKQLCDDVRANLKGLGKPGE